MQINLETSSSCGRRLDIPGGWWIVATALETLSTYFNLLLSYVIRGLLMVTLALSSFRQMIDDDEQEWLLYYTVSTLQTTFSAIIYILFILRISCHQELRCDFLVPVAINISSFSRRQYLPLHAHN